MTEIKAPPQIFDTDLLRVRRARAGTRAISFLLERCALDASERITDINRRFERALILGAPDFTDLMLSHLSDEKTPRHVTRCFDSKDPEGLDQVCALDDLPFQSGSFDLVISALNLHTINDLPGALLSIRNVLKPDGLFIGSMFGGDTLIELRQACFAADENVLGGFSPRVLPFANYSQSAGLLQRAGFALPVIDTDRVNVSYSKLSRLLSDIRDLGEGNCLKDRNKKILGKAYLNTLTTVYEDQFGHNDKLKATFEILWLTGWIPHESQQKPLKPGSAQISLAEALRSQKKT